MFFGHMCAAYICAAHLKASLSVKFPVEPGKHSWYGLTLMLDHKRADTFIAPPALLNDMWNSLVSLPVTQRANTSIALAFLLFLFCFQKSQKLLLYGAAGRPRNAHHLHPVGVKHTILL